MQLCEMLHISRKLVTALYGKITDVSNYIKCPFIRRGTGHRPLVSHTRVFTLSVLSWHEAASLPSPTVLHADKLPCSDQLTVAHRSNRRPRRIKMGIEVAKKSKKKIVRREYTKADVKELRAHSKARTPLAKIMRLTKRTEGSLR